MSPSFQQWYERAVLTETPGLGPSLARGIFALAACAVALALGLRRIAYGAGLLRPCRAPVPVISVGNVTTGGAGKTPAAVWLCRRLAQRGLRVALLARGYGRTEEGADDEAPPPGVLPDGVVRLVGARRAALVREAVERHGVQAIVLDDGFQHWRVARDLDVLCVDALDPFGNERLMPAGPLREPLGALRRASAFLLTRTDLCTPEEMGALRVRMRALAGGRPVVESIHRPTVLMPAGRPAARRAPSGGSRDGSTQGDMIRGKAEEPFLAADWLRGRRVCAFCGIGSPRGFRKTLAALGAALMQFRAFPDHHRYRKIDLDRIAAEAKELMVEALVTTEKDLARLSGVRLPLPLFAVRVELEVTRGGEGLDELLEGVLGGAQRTRERDSRIPASQPP